MKKLIISALAALFLMLPQAALAGDVTLVQAEGTAAKADDIVEVKKKAMEQALRNAVLETARELLAKESLSATDQALQAIASSPRAYVLNYKIRSEGWITHMDSQQEGANGTELYHIWVESSIDTGALRAALSKIVSSNESLGLVVINILDVKDYPTFRLVLDSIQKIAFIKEVSYNSFTAGRITLVAAASGDAPSLAGRIAREVPEKFAVMEGAGQIIIRPSALVTR